MYIYHLMQGDSVNYNQEIITEVQCYFLQCVVNIR